MNDIVTRMALDPEDEANGVRFPTPPHLTRPGWTVYVYRRVGAAPADRGWTVRCVRADGRSVYAETGGGAVEYDPTLVCRDSFGVRELAAMAKIDGEL